MNTFEPLLRSLASDWRLVVGVGDTEDARMVIFRRASSKDDLVQGPGSTYEVGLMLNVPHGDRTITVHHAIKRHLSEGVSILMHKNSTFKLENQRDPDLFKRSINNVARQTFNGLKAYVIERLMQIHHVTASLEECLSVVAITKGAAYDALRVDDTLTAHGMVAPSDRWPMYRRQANSPNSKLDLMNVMSEYSRHTKTSGEALKIMALAGDIMVIQGDLESRPAWKNFPTQDRSDVQYFMKQ